MTKDFYIKVRNKIADVLNDNEVMILFAGKDICQSEDESYKFTINRNFYYLTGIAEQNDILLMKKINGSVNTTIFINKYDELAAKWYGRKLLVDEVKELSGIENVAFLDEFEDQINNLVADKYTFLLDNNDCLFAEPYGEARRLAEKLTKHDVTIKNCHDLIAIFRMEKQPEEIQEIQKAISITNKGIEAIMQNIKPGLVERQAESYFDQQIKYHGASNFAFKTIAASGKNGCVLHYSTNNTVIGDSELVLFDLGAEYNLYKADISRTLPANGKFTARQKQIYNIVLEGQKLVFSAIKPGVTLRDLNNILIKYYMTELKKIGLIHNDNEVKKYYFHGVSHHLGLDTHDVALRDKPLTPGCVITVEPGLYIAEEGIGIRIEDDALVTVDGAINLSEEIIKSVDDIEQFMSTNNLNISKNHL